MTDVAHPLLWIAGQVRNDGFSDPRFCIKPRMMVRVAGNDGEGCGNDGPPCTPPLWIADQVQYDGCVGAIQVHDST